MKSKFFSDSQVKLKKEYLNKFIENGFPNRKLESLEIYSILFSQTRKWGSLSGSIIITNQSKDSIIIFLSRGLISVLYKSYQTLFVHHWNSFSTKEPEIDVENDLPPVKRPYDHEKSLKLMDECQNNADFFNPSVMAIDDVQVE